MTGVRGSKRTLEEIVMHEDSDDDDYDDKAPGQSSKPRTRIRRADRPARKKQRRGGYRGSDVDSDDEEVLSDEDSFQEDSEEEEIETNERGRPIRKSAKKAITYEESSEEDELSRSSSEERTPAKKPRLVVTLKTGLTPMSKQPSTTRTLRNRSGSYGPRSSAPSASNMPPTRRSSRLSHDEDEPVVALTHSGNHVEIVRAGSRDPEGIPARALKGGKGIKYPSKSTIDEEPESVQTKQEDDTEELEIKSSQHEIMESAPQTQEQRDNPLPQITSDVQGGVEVQEEDARSEDDVDPLHGDDAEDDDEDPVTRGRSTRASTKRKAASPIEEEDASKRLRRRNLRSAATERPSHSQRRKAQDESSDFDPAAEQDREENMSTSSESEASVRRTSHRNDDYDSSNNGRRSNRLRSKAASRQRSPMTDEEEDLAAELAELKRDTKKKRPSGDEILFEPRGTRRAAGKKPNYDLLRNLAPIEDDDDEAAPTPSQRAKKAGTGAWQRSLFSTYGPFGGAGGPTPVLGGPFGPRAQGDVDSDSSDEEVMKQPRPVGGTVGMTPTTAGGFNLFPQPMGGDPSAGIGGTPANLGKVKDKQALADADPLGVDQNVNFDSVGGLQGHIDQLKEMVALPLLYPEIFMRFHITPPRGVLFHGPPGTGKTLLARALASSVSSSGRKVTFYMRKGADALSKWVGEAERQLRLLFEEARKNQPSIIFFDEIDGLAPVRSSKQEQIHASIVSTLLALMDGMDGRGQVIVIGATNRPDSIDPALRRPGRFDREFYFPLPNTEARRSILDIHTKGWKPPLDSSIKDQLAELTKGYGGADLRALCTEAALNAVQRRYPQIYSSNEKLLIDPKTIEVMPKDFMISVKKMVPSSQRSASSGASPLPESLLPLLRKPLEDIKAVLKELLPQKKQLTALQEAQFEDTADGRGFGRELMQQAFESSRVFRPRLLIHGKVGMGQQYLAAALLNHFEGLHVQAFDLPTLLSDTASSPEATVIRLFSEVKMHKPSVIYIPNVEEWYSTVGQTVISTFIGLLRSLKPTDPVLLMGILENEDDHVDESIRRELFGYSKRNQFVLRQPGKEERLEYFAPLKDYIRTSPSDFPDPANRKKREFEKLAPAPPDEPEKKTSNLSKEEQKAQKKRDRQTLNMLKIRLQPIMDQIRTKHKKFRTGVIEESQIRYLYDEADPGTVTSDLHTDLLARASFRPFEIGKDQHGVPGLVDQSNGKFFYNLDSVTIEKRLSNGYYKRPKDFLADIKRLAKDAKTIGDDDRLLKANELLANVEVDIGGIEFGEPAFTAECERVYQREVDREKEAIEKARATAEGNRDMPPPRILSNVPHEGASGPSTTAPSDGPVFLGEPLPRGHDLLSRFQPVTPSRPLSHSTVVTNGIHAGDSKHDTELMNGSSSHGGNEADVERDTPMGGTDSQPGSHERSNETQRTHTTSSFGNRASAQPRPFHSYTAPSQRLQQESGMSAPKSQTGGITPMAPGSQAADYQNDASTTQTTSGKKNSGPSTGDQDHSHSQEPGPNLFVYDERRSAGGSEVPDTQVGDQQNSNDSFPTTNSEPSQSHLQPWRPESSHGPDRASQPPVPPFETPSSKGQHQPRTNGHLKDLLNPAPAPNLIQPEEKMLENMHTDIGDKTSGLSVEQLEQVNSVLMDTLWQTRGEWDRSKVLNEVGAAFNFVMDDMVDVGQSFGANSWGKQQP